MRKIFIIILILFCSVGLFAQKEYEEYHHFVENDLTHSVYLYKNQTFLYLIWNYHNSIRMEWYSGVWNKKKDKIIFYRDPIKVLDTMEIRPYILKTEKKENNALKSKNQKGFKFYIQHSHDDDMEYALYATVSKNKDSLVYIMDEKPIIFNNMSVNDSIRVSNGIIEYKFQPFKDIKDFDRYEEFIIYIYTHQISHNPANYKKMPFSEAQIEEKGKYINLNGKKFERMIYKD